MQEFIFTPAGRLSIQLPPTSSIRYSHLYGYRSLESVPDEQAVIRFVVQTIASSIQPIEEVVASLVDNLNSRGIRRGTKRWINATVVGLVRPVFGGRILVDGGYAVSQLYQEIVPWSVMQLAIEKVQGLK